MLLRPLPLLSLATGGRPPVGHAAAGWRVSVWDEEEAAFLDGCVVGFDARANHFLVSGHTVKSGALRKQGWQHA